MRRTQMKNLDKIIGYPKQVERLELVYDILESPERYQKFDTELPKNLLLYGAAGVGKTFMAEVLMKGCGRTPFSDSHIEREGNQNELFFCFLCV